MADNIAVEAVVTPGSTFAADDISSVLYPRTKIALGADGSATDAEGGAGAANAGTQRVIAASDSPEVTSLALIDDVIKTDDAAWSPASDKVLMIGGEVDNSLTNTLDEGDAGAFRMTTNRAMHVNIRNDSGTEVTSFGPTQYTVGDAVAGTEKVTYAGVVVQDSVSSGGLTDGLANYLRADSHGRLHIRDTAADAQLALISDEIGYLTKIEDAPHASGDFGIMPLAVRKDTAAALAGTDGDYAPLEVDANGRLHVNGSGVTQPISAASLPLPSGAATEATLDARTGSLTETAPATDTASSGLNGRLQRIAQRLTSLIALLPASLGQKAKTASLAVVIASDQDALPITDNSGSLTVDNNGTFAVQATVAAAATNIAKAEDVASANADVGVPSMAVRKATPANTSDTDGDYEFLQMSAGRLWASVAVDTALPAGTNAIGKLAANAGVYIGDVGHGKTLKVASGTLTADTDVIAAVSSKRIKVYAYSIISTGTNANAMIFKSGGTAGTELWRLLLQGAASQPVGANLALTPPGFLFATVAGEKLTLDVGNSDTIHYSIAYWDDDAT